MVMQELKRGCKVKFTYFPNETAIAKQEYEMALSGISVSKEKLSDEEIFARFDAEWIEFFQWKFEDFVKNGWIQAARYFLYMKPNAVKIRLEKVEEPQPQRQQGGDAGAAILILVVLAIVLAVICFPLLVMLGMHGKLFLKGFYEKCEGDEYKGFVKKYTYVGIGLYALVIILAVLDNLLKLYVLTGPAFGLLFVGGIAYFVVSLLLTKKKFLGEDYKINVVDTLKGAFKKEKK